VKTRVKICGITRLEDALVACELGADALGFVFHKPSPRYVEPEKAAEIIAQIPRLVTTVGVLVDLPAGRVREIVRTAGLDRAQLSGDESPEYCQSLGVPWIKGFRVAARSDLDRIAQYVDEGDFLLDSFVKGIAGGTGKKFNWEWAGQARTHGRLILAGGLSADNVAEAIRTVKPYAVDVSSGVEREPGIKDHAKLEAFFGAVAAAG